ncbi:MAG: 30S ribosomal protein S6 [Candidatus Gracilibacteria bacterium]|jgi:small subunit ribosomal protein S6|nr:30S ribosomal protein S6 [Candidatus Gracilibacteria bacterium]
MAKKTNGEARGYELMLILSPNLSEAETQDELNNIKQLVSELGGNVFSEDIWGIRELAYTIKQCDKGYYAVYYMDFDVNEKVKELEKALTIQNTVLRSLIIKISKHHVIKTHDEYSKEAEIEEAEEKKIKEEKEKENQKRQAGNRRPERRTEVKSSEKTAPKKTVRKEEKEEVVEEKPKAKKEESDSKKSLSEVDKKLKSLIDDPDISL